LGTPQKVTTTVGAVVWTAIYDSFGSLWVRGRATLSN
jgi:hypothetical protein